MEGRRKREREVDYEKGMLDELLVESYGNMKRKAENRGE